MNHMSLPFDTTMKMQCYCSCGFCTTKSINYLPGDDDVMVLRLRDLVIMGEKWGCISSIRYQDRTRLGKL
jgi:hypothetical protein